MIREPHLVTGHASLTGPSVLQTEADQQRQKGKKHKRKGGENGSEQAPARNNANSFLFDDQRQDGAHSFFLADDQQQQAAGLEDSEARLGGADIEDMPQADAEMKDLEEVMEVE